MFVKICKLGENQEVTTFPTGTHVLGRGPSLQCNDKRVSRNHATLEVGEDSVKLTSTHVNPCFLKAANSKTLTILAKDSTSQLNDGDSFALLPEDFWFKIKLGVKEEMENEAGTTMERGNETNKRLSCSYSEDAPPDKKPKMETNKNNNTSEVPSSSVEENGKHDITEQEVPASSAEDNITEQENIITSQSTKEEVLENNENEFERTNTHDLEVTDGPIKEKVEAPNEENKKQNDTVEETPDQENTVSDTNNVSQNGEAANEENKKQNDTVEQIPDQENVVSDTNNVSQNDDASNKETKKQDEDATSSNGVTGGNPGPAQLRPHREKCWYGAECYRKNPMHRQDYTHPGDSDFESDTDDNRPSCSFGATCYRKNKLHRQQYKHPPRERPGKKKRSRKKVNRLNAANSQDVRDFYDEFSDSEDPFIADDDSDEYTGESDEDSDWDDSPDTDED